MMDADKRMADLINITTRLIDVLERENVLLLDHRHGELNTLIDEKETISRVYQARIMGLQENPNQLDGGQEETRVELKKLALKVDHLISQNSKMLGSAMITSKRIVDLVADALRESTTETSTYSDAGVKRFQPSKRKDRMTALSFNEML